MSAAKVPVFFIDDKQNVRPDETGSAELVRSTAARMGVELSEFELETQFRCAGSDHFVRWISNTLGIEPSQDALYSGDEDFDFRVVSTPEELETLIRQRAGAGFTARLTAGFCWPWSDPLPDGSLVEDVKIGSYSRPWNAKPDGKHSLKKGIPKSTLWATDPNGLEQIGCIYTAQGFEFDYVGVIWGKDLVFDFRQQSWVGSRENSCDAVVKRSKEALPDLLKHSYRVLLSRGMKGCYLCFLDDDTKRFVESRIGAKIQSSSFEMHQPEPIMAAEEFPAKRARLPFRLLDISEARPWENCVPLVDLEVAAGIFSTEQQIDEPNLEPASTRWVALPDAFRPSKGLFVARVVGESMNRRIPDGAWCLFKWNPTGSRQGKVVVAALRLAEDSETGAHYTVKAYSSDKVKEADGSWHHSRVLLIPDSSDRRFVPLVFEGPTTGDLRIVAELVAVLG